MTREPLIIAIASGKGGVGKTMLSVACAYELSLGSPTLLLDLDFFNRGLSGLFAEGEAIAEIPRPDFLGAADPAEKEPWRLVRISRDLFHVTFPDLGPAELSGLEISAAGAIRESLARFIESVRKKCGALSVVLDCHGGPDHTSFAAAMLARHTLLVSEPDRVTFHGTFNFLRQLDRAIGDSGPFAESVSGVILSGASPTFSEHGTSSANLPITPPPSVILPPPTADVRLIFNKVVPAFRAPFLRRLYDENLREEFGGFDLLAIFPLELPLTKAFEETPLLTRAYPYSLLARKMRVLLLDLLGERAQPYLAPSAPTLPGWVRRYRRSTLGRVPWWLNHEVILQIVTFATFLAMIVSYLDTRFTRTQEDALRKALILTILAEYPTLNSHPASQYHRFLRGEYSDSSRALLSEPSMPRLGLTNEPILRDTSLDKDEHAFAERQSDAMLKVWEQPASEARDIEFAKLARARTIADLDAISWNPRDVPATEQVDSLIRWFQKELITHARWSLRSDPSLGRRSFDIVDGPDTSSWRRVDREVLRRFARQTAPPLYIDQWKTVAQTLRSAGTWEWRLHDLRMFWHAWYWHAMILALGWLGTAFYLDWTRRLDARFTRKLRDGYYVPAAVMLFAVGLWALPAFLINSGLSIQSGPSYMTPSEVVAWALVLPYLFVIGHQIYRCWRLVYEGVIYFAALRGQEASARSTWSLVFYDLLPGNIEVWLRLTFVGALIGALCIFYLLVFKGVI